MATDNQHDIRILNGLLSATLDNAQSYQEAAASSDDPGHKTLFETRAADHHGVAEQLQAAVVGLGGEPDRGGSILAKAKRAVMDVKQALMPDEASVLGDAEGGESLLLGRYDRALADSHISATTRETLRRARAEISEGHAAIGVLRHSVQGQKDAESDIFPS